MVGHLFLVVRVKKALPNRPVIQLFIRNLKLCMERIDSFSAAIKAKYALFFVSLCSILVTAYIGCSYTKINLIYAPSSVTLPGILSPEKIISPVKAYQHIFKRNDTFFSIMHGFGLSGAQVSELVSAAKPWHPLTRIKAGSDGST